MTCAKTVTVHYKLLINSSNASPYMLHDTREETVFVPSQIFCSNLQKTTSLVTLSSIAAISITWILIL